MSSTGSCLGTQPPDGGAGWGGYGTFQIQDLPSRHGATVGRARGLAYLVSQNALLPGPLRCEQAGPQVSTEAGRSRLPGDMFSLPWNRKPE